MSTLLRDLLGLPALNKRETSTQAVEFKQAFRAGMANVNKELQAVAAHSTDQDYQIIDAQRSRLIEAFQKASSQVDPANRDNAAPAIERVLAAVVTLREKSASLATRLKSGRDNWFQQEENFDNALLQIGELEDSQHPKAASLRQVGEAIRTRANNGKYQEAGAALKQFQPKLAELLSANSLGGAAPQQLAQSAAAATPLLGQASRDYAEKSEGKSAPPSDELNPATTFPTSKSPVDEEDGRLSAAVAYDSLPEKLKERLSQQFWSGLEKRQRSTLVETYRRLRAYGAWDQVKRITGEKEKPELHFKILDWEFEVDGNSGGLTYEAYSGSALVEKLIATGHFGKDGELMGSKHKGQKSLREWRNNVPNVPTSLHISVGPGNNFDAHIDKVSPVSSPKSGKTIPDANDGLKHWGQEIIPEWFRNKIGIPVSSTDAEEDADGMVKIEFRGPAEKTKKPFTPKPVVANPAPKDVQLRIQERMKRTKNRFPIPIGSAKGGVPVPKAVATSLAANMLEAAKNGKNRIAIDLPYYHDNRSEQPAALKAIEEIGRIVRDELVPESYQITAVTVTFGSNKQGETVWIAE